MNLFSALISLMFFLPTPSQAQISNDYALIGGDLHYGATGLAGDSGTGGGFQIKGDDGTRRADAYFNYMEDKDGNPAVMFQLLYSEKNPETNMIKDFARLRVSPLKTELNMRFFSPSVSFFDESHQSGMSYSVRFRPMTYAIFQTRKDHDISTNVESGIDLEVVKSIYKDIVQLTVETSGALGWFQSASSSRYQIEFNCKLGEKSPWCLSIGAMSESVAYTENTLKKGDPKVYQRDEIQNFRVGITYHKAD